MANKIGSIWAIALITALIWAILQPVIFPPAKYGMLELFTNIIGAVIIILITNYICKRIERKYDNK